MSLLISRRMLLLASPVAYFSSMKRTTPVASPGGSASGIEGGRYTSPSFGWSMDVRPDIWEVAEASSNDGVDVLTLHGLPDATPTTTVIFRTSPPEFETLEQRMLFMRTDELPVAFDSARLTVGEDVDSRPIYGVLNNEGTEVKADDHWIASYVARYAIEENPARDWIIELDIIGFPDTGSVLTIDARSQPDDYEAQGFDLVEELRHSIYANTSATSSTLRILPLSTLRAGGGSRPRVQY
jgi:hypothetical protein